MIRSLLAPLLVAAGLSGLVGCSRGPEFAPVSGRVLVNGKPADKVRVEFHPDGGTTGPASFAETDADGRFKLAYAAGDRTGEGAVVGPHRVVLQDLRLSESETGAGVAVRFGPEYGAVLTTTLRRDVQSGPQEIEIALGGR